MRNGQFPVPTLRKGVDLLGGAYWVVCFVWWFCLVWFGLVGWFVCCCFDHFLLFSEEWVETLD